VSRIIEDFVGQRYVSIWDLRFVEEFLPSICNIVFGLDNSFVVSNIHHSRGQLNHRFLDEARLDLEEGWILSVVVLKIPFQPKPVGGKIIKSILHSRTFSEAS